MRRHCGVGNHLRGFIGIIPIHHNPMHVVTLDQRSPFKADKSGKPAWIIIFFRRIDSLLPDRTIRSGIGGIIKRLREFTLGKFADDFKRHIDTIAGLYPVIPVFASGVA